MANPSIQAYCQRHGDQANLEANEPSKLPALLQVAGRQGEEHFPSDDGVSKWTKGGPLLVGPSTGEKSIARSKTVERETGVEPATPTLARRLNCKTALTKKQKGVTITKR